MIKLFLSSRPNSQYISKAKESFHNYSPNSIWQNLEIYNIDIPKIDSDILVIIGVGGSYLGIDAAIRFLNLDRSRVIFLGNNLDPEYLKERLDKIKGSISVNVISKSGNTLETIVSLNLLLEHVERCGIDCKKNSINYLFFKKLFGRISFKKWI